MAQTTIDITKIKDRDTATALNTVGTIFEAGTFSGTASVVAGTASREVTISVAANLVKLVNSGTDADIGTVITPKGAGVVALGGTTVANSGVQVPIVTSSVNFLKVSGGATGTGVTVLASGTDGTVDLRLQSTSTGVVALGGTTTANASAQVATVASAVNFLNISGSITGANTAGPILAANGTDSNIALHLRTKGTGIAYLGGSSAATAGLQVASTASAVNNIVITNAATGNAPSIALGGSGSDANRNLTIAAAGTGAVAFSTQIARTISDTLTAIGTNQGTGLALTKDFNIVTSAAGGTGVILPAAIVGAVVYIQNDGANAIKVYGNGSDTVDGQVGSTGVTLTNTKRAWFMCTAAATWKSAQAGVASA
jgi:hypothetical protein